jgi:hypothetical protein
MLIYFFVDNCKFVVEQVKKNSVAWARRRELYRPSDRRLWAANFSW